ncbi:methionyl-tRNA formyltransferase [Proteocatella sphenisci]|uniref:methionyl-tRNA formyltransferase n=1 Tax=Proteocatella sphenisci TaxID=181070 RepID=UPI00048D47A2|nr:methionyl-tRNA formyltransferase [Proteocatella sphenisci]
MKIIFMGTPEFAVNSLEVLKERGDEVLLVISQKDKPKGRGKKLQPTPVKEKALEYGFEVYQPDRVKEKQSVELIKSLNPDLIVVTAFGQILTKEILDIPRLGCINVHASLLPKYRGAAPINFAIINGEEKTGITTMYMAEGLDTGDIILSDEIDIEPEDTSGSLHDKLADLSKKTLSRTLELFEKGQVPRIAQDHSKSSYAPMMNKELGHLDFSQDAKAVINLARGVDPWPSAYAKLNDETVKLFDLKLGNPSLNNNYGEIIDVKSDCIEIRAKESSVLVYEVQFPNKKRMPVKEYLKGNDIKRGDLFV